MFRTCFHKLVMWLHYIKCMVISTTRVSENWFPVIQVKLNSLFITSGFSESELYSYICQWTAERLIFAAACEDVCSFNTYSLYYTEWFVYSLFYAKAVTLWIRRASSTETSHICHLTENGDLGWGRLEEMAANMTFILKTGHRQNGNSRFVDWWI